jgi:hypothetical protein
MTAIDWIKKFKEKIYIKTNVKTSWGRVELSLQIEKAYQETLEEMVEYPNTHTEATKEKNGVIGTHMSEDWIRENIYVSGKEDIQD